MLNYDELKKQLIKAVDVIDYEFSDAELKDIFEEVEKYPEYKRTKALWQSIIKQKSGAKSFKLYKAFDYSDINYIHQQIQDLLKKK